MKSVEQEQQKPRFKWLAVVLGVAAVFLVGGIVSVVEHAEQQRQHVAAMDRQRQEQVALEDQRREQAELEKQRQEQAALALEKQRQEQAALALEKQRQEQAALALEKQRQEQVALEKQRREQAELEKQRQEQAELEKQQREQIVELWKVEKKPVITKRVNPKYPATALKANITGKVFVTALIGKDGKVEKIGKITGPKPLRAVAKAAAL